VRKTRPASLAEARCKVHKLRVIGEGSPQASAAMLQLVSHAAMQMGPNWVMLLNVSVARDVYGTPSSPSQVGFALLHPERGIALLDVAPANTLNATLRLRRALAAARFPLIFAGQPPIVYRQLTLENIPRLNDVVDAAFAGEPPISLHGGHAWTGLARRVLGGERCLGPAVPTRQSMASEALVFRPRPTPPHPARHSPGLRALAPIRFI